MPQLYSGSARVWRGGKIKKEKQEKEGKEEKAIGFLPRLGTHILPFSASHCVTQVAADAEYINREQLLQEGIITGHFRSCTEC